MVQAVCDHASELILTLKPRAEKLDNAAPDSVRTVENPQCVELVYLIPGRGRDRNPFRPPARLCAALIRVLLLRAGVPDWNQGAVKGTLQTTSVEPRFTTNWKLESSGTTRGLRLGRQRD